jgi:PilZ domain-containing protein/sporulation related protein
MLTEHRHAPRFALKNLAYVNLEPDNGGILIDVSAGGISFRSAVPVPQSSTVRFSFSLDNHRIEASGRLAWSDATRKRGGLKFTSVSPEAQRAISDWIGQHALPVSVNEEFAPPPRSLPESTFLTSDQRRNAIATDHDSLTLAAFSPSVQLPRLLTGFSGGLVAGILISALVAGLFVLQTHRRELGASLIHLGERLGGNSVSQPALPEPETVSLGRLAETQSPSHTQIPISRQERAVLKPAAAPVQPHEMHLVPAAPASTTAHPSANVQPPANTQPASQVQASALLEASAPPATSSSTPARPLVPVIAVAPTSEPSADMLRPAVAQVNLAAQPVVRVEQSKQEGTGSPAEKFLEVGRFNNRLWADKTTEKLSQFGFPFSVVQKNNFWKKSYQVLVGPYGTDQEAETVHKTLASRGFTPRSFERGSRDFRIPRLLRLDGASLPVGECTISWESYLPDAIVKIQMNRSTAVVEGKWVDRKVKYVTNAVVYTEGRDGSRILTEIRFSGMGRALVFGSGNI